jgi:hypothetical protein
VARHLDSLIPIANKLVEEGFLLAQISVMYHPQAKCANVLYDYSKDRLSVEWVPYQASDARFIQHAGASYNLETIVKRSIDEEKRM